jgi:hypothetical protein
MRLGGWAVHGLPFGLWGSSPVTRSWRGGGVEKSWCVRHRCDTRRSVPSWLSAHCSVLGCALSLVSRAASRPGDSPLVAHASPVASSHDPIAFVLTSRPRVSCRGVIYIYMRGARSCDIIILVFGCALPVWATGTWEQHGSRCEVGTVCRERNSRMWLSLEMGTAGTFIV